MAATGGTDAASQFASKVPQQTGLGWKPAWKTSFHSVHSDVPVDRVYDPARTKPDVQKHTQSRPDLIDQALSVSDSARGNVLSQLFWL